MAIVTKISNAKVYNVIQMQLEKQSVIAKIVRDESARAEKGDSSINLPTLLPRTAQVHAATSTVSLTANSNGFEDDILTLDQAASDYCEFLVHSEQQNVFDGIGEAQIQMYKAIALALEKDLITKAIAAAQVSEIVVPVAGGDPFYNAVAGIRKTMRDADIPFEGDIYGALTTTHELYALQTKQVTSYIEKGDGSALSTARLGSLLGIQLVVPSNSAAMTESFFFHKLGLVFAWHGQIVVMLNEVGQGLKKTLAVSRKFNSKATQSGKLIYKWTPA